MRRPLRTAAIELAAAVALASPAAAQAGQGAGAPGSDDARIQRGIQVYAAQKCTICHSIAGTGNGKGPLDGVGSRLTAEEVREWIVNPAEMTRRTNATRKPEMRAYPNLPAEDLDALVAYMMSIEN